MFSVISIRVVKSQNAVSIRVVMLPVTSVRVHVDKIKMQSL